MKKLTAYTVAVAIGVVSVTAYAADSMNGTKISDKGIELAVTGSANLEVPNAFSPNNDGVNDVFLVKHKSLIQFDATVFNRWGKEIYHWGLDNIDRGWDGTFRGKQVPEGVYFIVIKAKGSDGVIYDIKSDINILR